MFGLTHFKITNFLACKYWLKDVVNFLAQIRKLCFRFIGQLLIFNPLSPKIHIQILHTDLHTLLLRTVERIWFKIKVSSLWLFNLVILITFTLVVRRKLMLVTSWDLKGLLAIPVSEYYFIKFNSRKYPDGLTSTQSDTSTLWKVYAPENASPS